MTNYESRVVWLPPGPGSLAVDSYRKGLYAEAVHHCKEFIETSDHPFHLTRTHLLLALAHQKMGQSDEARKELDVGRKLMSGLGRIYGAGLSGGKSNLMNYGWTEWLDARILCDEAEALILYDPMFPANPFAA